MNKNIIAIVVAIIIIGAALTATLPERNNQMEIGMEELVDCFEEEEVVIYGSYTCPACTQLIESFGGDDMIEPIYVECMEEGEVCDEEKVTGYVPEIQIAGELYEGANDPASLAREVGCEF